MLIKFCSRQLCFPRWTDLRFCARDSLEPGSLLLLVSLGCGTLLRQEFTCWTSRKTLRQKHASTFSRVDLSLSCKAVCSVIISCGVVCVSRCSRCGFSLRIPSAAMLFVGPLCKSLYTSGGSTFTVVDAAHFPSLELLLSSHLRREACTMTASASFELRKWRILQRRAQKSPRNVSDVDRFVSRKNVVFSAFQEVFFPQRTVCHGQVFSRSKNCFSTASHPDEALPVFALFLTAGVAASRRRAGRAGRHLPVCCLELATRQIHENAPRSAQLAAALGTSPAGPQHEPPRAPAGHPLAAPGLVATRRSYPFTDEELAHIKIPHAAAAPVEDEPFRSAARPTSTPSSSENRATMGHAAVHVRGPASVPRAVCRDQPEHSLSLETERATSRDARQEKHAVARRRQLSEHIIRMTDVLCSSAVTIHGLVLE